MIVFHLRTERRLRFFGTSSRDGIERVDKGKNMEKAISLLKSTGHLSGEEQGLRKESIQEIFQRALSENRTYLMEHECKEILEGFGVTTTGFLVAASEHEAVTMSRRVGYPVVLKILSPDVVHKTDEGGVKLNLTSDRAVRAAYRDIVDTFKDHPMAGVSVQTMAKPGIEAIIGVTRDPSFGPVLMFGLGGVFVEVLKDVTFRVLPITENDAAEMIKEIKGYAILKGHRGQAVDLSALIKLIHGISRMVTEYPEIRELDLNPVFLYPSGYMTVDARIFLDPAPSEHRIIPKRSDDLRDLFYPQSIAVIGASNSINKLGYNVFRNLLSHDFHGALYPISPKKETVQGIKAYPSILDVKNRIDLAIVIVPADAALQTIEDCCTKGIRYVVVETAGFAETGEKGKQTQARIGQITAQKGVRILGPNCSGIINTHHNMVQSLGILDTLKKGNVGLIAQAGVYAAGILTGLRNVLDFGIVATIGNKMDITETDILQYMGEDENIDVIAMYMEDVTSGRHFIDVAVRVTSQKPVIVLKAGITEAGKEAVSSHTASLAGNDEINNAAFRQCGIIQARDNEHLFALTRAFSKQPLPKGPGVMVITYTGSLGVAATDMLYLNDLKLSELEPDLKVRMREILPDYLNLRNPVDCSFSMTPEQVKALIEIGTESREVQSFIVIIQGEMLGSFVAPLKSLNTGGKPILCCVACKEFMIDDVIKMEQAGFPVYATPEMSAEVLGEMCRYAGRCKKMETQAVATPLTDEVVVIDNMSLNLRPITQNDIDLWIEFVNGCSPRSLWLRFLSPFSATPENAERFCTVNPEEELAVVAEITSGDHRKLVGIARLIKNAPHHSDAEYAVIISDQWQRRRLGGILSERCMKLAKSWGVKTLRAETIHGNYRMVKILNKCNFKMEGIDGNMVMMSANF